MRKFAYLFLLLIALGASIPAMALDDTQASPPADGTAAPAAPGTELVDLRTATTSTYATDDPALVQTRVFPGPINFRQDDGSWRRIDTHLVDAGDGTSEVKANAFELNLAHDANNDQIARFGLDDEHSLGIGLLGAEAGHEAVNGSTQTIDEATPRTDLRLRATNTGLRFDLVLESKAAPTSYVLPLTARNLTASIDATGSVTFADENGDIRLTIPHGYMDDSAKNPSGDGAHSEDVTYSVTQLDDGRQALKVDLNADWVMDPARVFPIVVDPDIATALDDTYAQSPYTNNYSSDTQLKVGYCAAGTSCAGSGQPAITARSFMHFDLSSLAGQTITGASLNLDEFHSYSCDASQVVSAYRISSGTFPANLSFPGPTFADFLGSKAFAHGNTCAAAWDAIPISTTAIANWASGAWPNLGLGIRADNETSSSGWKKFYSANQSGAAPYLSITSVVNHDPTGSVDVIAGTQGRVRVAGWSSDVDTSGANKVAVYIDDTLINWYPADVYRSDVGSHGFDLMIDAATGTRHVCVYAINYLGASPSGPNPLLRCADVTVTAPVAPTAPQSVAATANNDGTVGITWTAPTSDGGRAIDTYYGYAFDAATNTYTGNSITACATCTSGSFSGLNLGTAYYFKVKAHNAVNNSFLSAASNTVTPRTAPSAPQTPNATENGTTATVSWTAPASTNGAALDGYLVQAYKKTGNSFVSQNGVCAICTTTTFTGLAGGTAYYFKVFAHNAAGFSAAAQSNDIPTPPAAPGKPTALVNNHFDAAEVAWAAPAYDGGSNIAQYDVYAKDTAAPATQQPLHQGCGGDCVTGPTPRQTLFTGLTPSHNYVFWVTATTAIGTGPKSPDSDTLTALGTDSLATPTNPTATRGDKQAALTWQAPTVSISGTTSYTVRTFRAADNVLLKEESAGSGAGPCGAATPPCFTIGGLINGTKVYFEVATNVVEAGPVTINGPYSQPSNSVTPAGKPFAPVNVEACTVPSEAVKGQPCPNPQGQQATVAWDSPPSPDGGVTPGNNGDPIVDAISSYTVTAHATNTAGCAEPQPTTSQTTQATVIGLTNGCVYTFTVTATNDIGTGPDSAASNQVTAQGPPSPPALVGANGGQQDALVSWDPSNANGGTIQYYVVTASPGGAQQTTPTSAPTATEMTFTGLAPNQSYTFTVAAVSTFGRGAESAASNEVMSTEIPAAPDAPTNVTAVAGGHKATVSWSPATPHGAYVYSYTVTALPSGPSVTTPDGETTTAVVTGLTNGQAYSFAVVANSAAGTSSATSPSVTPAPPPAPGQPKAIWVDPGSGHATVTWSPPENNPEVSTYTVTASHGASPVVVDGSTFTAELTGFSQPDYDVTFAVQASDDGVAGGTISSGSVNVGLPGAPPVIAKPGPGKVGLTWTDSAEYGIPVDHYELDRVNLAPASPQKLADFPKGDPSTYTFTETNDSDEFIVIPVTANGKKGQSQDVIVVANTPTAPTNVTLTATSNGSATLHWDAPDYGNPTSYEVRETPSAAASFDQGKAVGAPVTGTTMQLTNLTPGATYSYRVAGINSAGEGGFSALSNRVTIPNIDHYFGLDTNDFLTSKEVAAHLAAAQGPVDFYGRYIGGRSSIAADANVEMAALREHGVHHLLVIAHGFCQSKASDPHAADTEADSVLKDASALHLPTNGTFTIFLDVETGPVPGPDCKGTNISPEFAQRWVARMKTAGYVPGFYGNPNGNYLRQALATLNPNDIVLFSNNPQLGRSKQANAPSFAPSVPASGGTVAAWQYGEPPLQGTDELGSANVDTDEIRPDSIARTLTI